MMRCESDIVAGMYQLILGQAHRIALHDLLGESLWDPRGGLERGEKCSRARVVELCLECFGLAQLPCAMELGASMCGQTLALLSAICSSAPETYRFRSVMLKRVFVTRECGTRLMLIRFELTADHQDLPIGAFSLDMSSESCSWIYGAHTIFTQLRYRQT